MKRNVKIILGVALLVIVLILIFMMVVALDTTIVDTVLLGKTYYTMEANVFETMMIIAMFSTALCAIGAIVMLVSGLRSKN
jgi:hypothetical protein